MNQASSAALAARHAHVRQVLEEAGIDALVVSHLPNIFYLANFAGTAAIVVLTREALHFVTDFRYLSAVSALQTGPSACPGVAVCPVEQSYEETLAARLAALGLPRVGFEAAHLTVSRLRWMQAALRNAGPVELVATEGIVESGRIRKDAGERATLREAARRLSAVLQGVLADVAAGQLETEVALALETGMRRTGFTRPAFDTIVASGPNSALPHARAGDRRLTSGDLVVLDFGGVYNGYCVDLTRTVSLGPPSPQAVRVYDAVRRAQAAAIAAVAPGVALTAVDAAARDSLTSDGLGEAFGHGTGHGLGIEVHEAPRVARANPATAGRTYPPGHVPEATTLEAGMVATIEPGAYLPGFGGVRIEDDVLVTAEGCEVLTTVGRDLLVC
jgi:Xaa-Pro aminopeptidase